MTSLFLGFFAGVLHVFAGPDHLAAGMAVRVRRPGGAWYYGGIWALGHAAGLTLIGLVYYWVRESGLVASISLFAERMVGVALILMGAWMLLRRHHPWVQD
ncbi:MAG: High-affinity nickel transporter, partial [Verrucomicrobia bacterium]|nr:High-affinity nickel transporter [Verrucomicrobiota bacterium]